MKTFEALLRPGSRTLRAFSRASSDDAKVWDGGGKKNTKTVQNVDTLVEGRGV